MRDEYDTVMETVLKTEFLTLLSEKYTTITRGTLPVNFGRRSVAYYTLQRLMITKQFSQFYMIIFMSHICIIVFINNFVYKRKRS